MTSIIVVLSLLIDYLFGEPKKFHPLVGFGHLVNCLEDKLLSPMHHVMHDTLSFKNRLAGIFACLLLAVTPTILLIFFIHYAEKNNHYFLLVEIIMLYLVIGSRSLEQHALQVKTSLANEDIETARKNVSYMVSRETEQLDEQEICKATIESVLENGSDAVFAPIFWFLIAGAPGALFHRLINTLDAMWGYRNQRYRDFGWFAARLDDLLNWAPARITAITYSISGKFKQGFYCWRTQAIHWESPNAGSVMASGAGALNLQLGGSATYHHKKRMRPILGLGLTPEITDINRAITLIKKSLVLWIIIVLCLELFR